MSRNAMHEAGVPEPGAAPVPGQGGGLCNCQALRRAARRATALYDTIMAPHGLRISQFAVLNRLHLGGPAGIQALAAGLVLDRTTLGRNLRPLERDELIRSEAEPGDRRVRRLVLTEAGLAALTGARPAWDAAQAQFEASYGAADAAVLRAALHRVTEVLEATPEPTHP